jgi:hypothetical protein
VLQKAYSKLLQPIVIAGRFMLGNMILPLMSLDQTFPFLDQKYQDFFDNMENAFGKPENVNKGLKDGVILY